MSIKKMLKWPYTRFLGSGAAIVGGAVMSAITQDPQYVATGGFLSSLGTSVLAADVHEACSRRLASNPDVFQSCDLKDLTGIAIAESVRKSLATADSDSEAFLQDLVRVIPEGWRKVAEHPMFHDTAQVIDTIDMVNVLVAPNSDAEDALPIGKQDWASLLTGIAELMLEKEANLQAIEHAAAHLQSEFAPALSESARREFTEQRGAYGTLHLLLLGEIIEALRACGGRDELADSVRQALARELESFGVVSWQHLSQIESRWSDLAATVDEQQRDRQTELLQQTKQLLGELKAHGKQIAETRSLAGRTDNRTRRIESKVDEIRNHLAKEEPSEFQQRNGPSLTISNVHRHMFVDRLFIGRRPLLRKLNTGFLRKTERPKPQVIYGLGGIGKTQIALEYSQRFESQYEIIWWLRAWDPSTLLGDLVELAIPLGVTVPVSYDQTTVANAVLDELSRRKNWLLIYDDAEAPQDVRGRLPGGPGHILVTSRSHEGGFQFCWY